jgi:hypothetical protein
MMAMGMITQYPTTNRIGATVKDQKLLAGGRLKAMYPINITTNPMKKRR